jgi:anhydro-N-acetylmuramic acid kinase
MKPLKVIGLMSGTSCDSIDATLCEVQPDLSCKLIHGINFSYPEKLRAKMFSKNVEDVCRLNFEVGKCFADAANVLISEFGKPDLIASHGQTIWHIPGVATLQIGESAVIAQETGCLIVSNFREADIAAGGQGAPLVCFADSHWFKDAHVQNIGGIANVTVLPDTTSSPDTSGEKPAHIYPFGFDTGPGNVIIDYCMQKFFNLPYDKDGVVGASGKVDESWLECLLQDEYYFAQPPKTTGREYFSPQYIENALRTAPKAPEDIIATVTALTAKSIALSYERFAPTPKTVIIGGGGAYNPTLMNFLRSYFPHIKTHEDYGISNNFKEAMAFALLGYCTYYNIPNNLPSCTGASCRVVLGKLTKA